MSQPIPPIVNAHPSPCDLSIIIVNWNTRELLAGCLESVARCQMSDVSVQKSKVGDQKSLSLDSDLRPLISETFVIDNASTDGSTTMVHERFPWVQLIENRENLGFARANNQAIRRSQGRYIMLLNSDTVLNDGAIMAMVGFADAYMEIGVLGPKLINGQGQTQLSWARFPSIWSEIMAHHHRDKKPFADGSASEVDWMAGACLLVRRTAIENVGLMDERFFLYSEETDWCKRIQEAGWLNVYYPVAVVSHFEGSSSSQDVPRSRFLLYQSKVSYAYKHFGKPQARLLKWVFVATSPLKAFWSLLHGRVQAARTYFVLTSRLLHMPCHPLAVASDD